MWHHPLVIEARAHLTPKLIDSLYVEAMVLADEARSYFDSQGREERMALHPLERVAFSCESLKVTTRLMHVIAWLLTQRAVTTGELVETSEEQAPRRLCPAPDSDDALVQALPVSAINLVTASRDLYARVRRIDDGSQAAPAASPARSLLRLLERSL